MKKKKGFTLVELLAVIVVLAIILVIAVPKILDVIKSSRENSIISSAKLIARNAEQKRLANEVLGEDVESYNCSEVADLNSTDYANCIVTFNSDGKAVVNITGSGKFKNMNVCNATKDNASVTEEECEDIEMPLVYLSPDWKNFVYETIDNEIAASSTSNILFDINPIPLYEQNFQTNLVEIRCDSGYYIGQLDFYTTKNVPSGITSNPYIDVSYGNDNTVKAYYKENSLLMSPCGNTLYNVYIVGDGKVSFPEYSGYLFTGLSYSKNINFNNSIDTSNVIDMEFMFDGCGSLTSLDLSHFDTSNVTNMEYMFAGCENLVEIDLSHFDTSKVTDMRCMFSNCSSLEKIDISNFNTDKVDCMIWMFSSCTSLNEVIGFTSLNLDSIYSLGCIFANTIFDSDDNEYVNYILENSELTLEEVLTCPY